MMGMRTLVSVLLVLLLVATALPGAAGAGSAPFIDPALQTAVAAASPTEQVQAVVNYDPAVTTGRTLTRRIQGLGAGTITFKHLDSVAVIGTARQINAVATLRGVRDSRKLK